MTIMNWVWPITALYWGAVAVYFYLRRGRQMSHRWAQEHRVDIGELMSSDGEDPPGYCRSRARTGGRSPKASATAAPGAPWETSSGNGSST